MHSTRREFGKVALAALPGVALLDGKSLAGSALLQARPNSRYQRRPDWHHHLQFPKHAGSERRSDAQVHPRLRSQRC